MTEATRNLLEKHFDTAFAAPDGIAKLRGLILTLAMQGKLVEQDPSDPPASELLKEIDVKKQRLVKAGTFRNNNKLSNRDSCAFILPQGWKWASVQQLGFLLGGKRLPKGHTYSETPTNYRYLTVTNMKNGTIIDNDVKYITQETHEAIKNYVVSKDEIYITIAGTIGAVGIIPEHCDGMNLTENASRLVFFSCNKLFLIHLLNSGIVQDQFAALTNKMAQPKLSLRSILSTDVPIPPLSEQRRIVARIGQLMAHCDELETLRKEREEKRLALHAAAIKKLLDTPAGSAWNFIQQHFGELYTVKENVSELRKAILQLAVMGRLIPQNPDDPPASELLKEIKAEKQRLVEAGKIKKSKPLPSIKPEEVSFELPQEWEWVRLGDVSLLNDSGWSPQCLREKRSKGQWGVLKVSAVTWGKFNPDENKALPPDKDPRPECEVKAGDFLLSRANTDELVARSVIVEETPEKLMMSDKIVRFRLSKSMNAHFINIVNGTESSRSYYVANASGTSSSMKNVSRQVMTELPIPLPPLPEQHRIVAKIDQLMALCDNLEQQINAATGKQTEMLNAVMAGVGG
jgi:type I restriction enzyme, S subunit